MGIHKTINGEFVFFVCFIYYLLARVCIKECYDGIFPFRLAKMEIEASFIGIHKKIETL